MKKLIKFLTLILTSIASSFSISSQARAMDKPNFDNTPPLSTASTTMSEIDNQSTEIFTKLRRLLEKISSSVRNIIDTKDKLKPSKLTIIKINSLSKKIMSLKTATHSEMNSFKINPPEKNDLENKIRAKIKEILNQKIELNSELILDRINSNNLKNDQIINLLKTEYESAINYLKELYNYARTNFNSIDIISLYEDYENQIESDYNTMINDYKNNPNNINDIAKQAIQKTCNFYIELANLLLDADLFEKIKC